LAVAVFCHFAAEMPPADPISDKLREDVIDWCKLNNKFGPKRMKRGSVAAIKENFPTLHPRTIGRISLFYYNRLNGIVKIAKVNGGRRGRPKKIDTSVLNKLNEIGQQFVANYEIPTRTSLTNELNKISTIDGKKFHVSYSTVRNCWNFELLPPPAVHTVRFAMTNCEHPRWTEIMEKYTERCELNPGMLISKYYTGPNRIHTSDRREVLLWGGVEPPHQFLQYDRDEYDLNGYYCAYGGEDDALRFVPIVTKKGSREKREKGEFEFNMETRCWCEVMVEMDVEKEHAREIDHPSYHKHNIKHKKQNSMQHITVSSDDYEGMCIDHDIRSVDGGEHCEEKQSAVERSDIYDEGSCGDGSDVEYGDDAADCSATSMSDETLVCDVVFVVGEEQDHPPIESPPMQQKIKRVIAVCDGDE
jgi:hypothetical protein